MIDDFPARCAADDRINKKFARTDIGRLKAKLIEQVTATTGGPATYTGRDMKETHEWMAVTAGEFDALVGDLVATLDRFGVPKAEQNELLGIRGPWRSDIVEIETEATGTELPSTYQAAPALVN